MTEFSISIEFLGIVCAACSGAIFVFVLLMVSRTIKMEDSKSDHQAMSIYMNLVLLAISSAILFFVSVLLLGGVPQ